MNVAICESMNMQACTECATMDRTCNNLKKYSDLCLSMPGNYYKLYFVLFSY